MFIKLLRSIREKHMSCFDGSSEYEHIFRRDSRLPFLQGIVIHSTQPLIRLLIHFDDPDQHLLLSTRCLAPAAQHLLLSTRCLAPAAHHLLLSTRCLAPERLCNV